MLPVRGADDDERDLDLDAIRHVAQPIISGNGKFAVPANVRSPSAKLSHAQSSTHPRCVAHRGADDDDVISPNRAARAYP
jgi:hypothetical protein